jgi:tetrahydromethanopterin S-methyltransferase subunit E
MQFFFTLAAGLLIRAAMHKKQKANTQVGCVRCAAQAWFTKPVWWLCGLAKLAGLVERAFRYVPLKMIKHRRPSGV